MRGLRAAAANLANARVRRLWIDSRFVTYKENPNDIDGVWETHAQIDLAVIDPVFLGKRDAMKTKYGLDLFPDVNRGGLRLAISSIFQIQPGWRTERYIGSNTRKKIKHDYQRQTVSGGPG